MHRAILTTLLYALVVMAFSITTLSCKGGSSSPVPAEPGEYIYNGRQWVTVADKQIGQEWSIYLGHDQIKVANFDAVAIHIHGNPFKWAQRFTPTEMQGMKFALGALTFMDMSKARIYALQFVGKSEYLEDMGDEHSAEMIGDKSDFSRGYSLYEFGSLPTSPSSKYFLTSPLGYICLQREG